MKWLEVSVDVEAEVAEAVAEVLSRHAKGGVAIEAGPEGWDAGPVFVRAYLPVDDELWTKKREIEEGLWHLGQIRPVPEPSFRAVAEKDWEEAWKKRLKVLRVGERIVIQPTWLDYEPRPEDIVIRLDPGMAFGTGLHPTTQICLRALEDFVRPEMEVLDLGTGSGILAIAAAKLEAARVLAMDSDPQAVRVARSNVIDNDMRDRVRVAEGSLSDVSGSYDLVVVNILTRVIVELINGGLAARLRPEALLITAGITVDSASEVVAAFKRGGLELVDRRYQDDWVSLLARRA